MVIIIVNRCSRFVNGIIYFLRKVELEFKFIEGNLVRSVLTHLIEHVISILSIHYVNLMTLAHGGITTRALVS